MSTHEQITNNPTSDVRNTWGRNGPQGLEEPMSDEVLREMCDKNYHQLLPLIAEKMQKEKEQKDKLNAVKARLIYGEESGVKIRSHEESHYSESKTPTARTEPRRRRGDWYSRSPSPHASVFKRLKKNRSPSSRPRPRKEGGVFNSKDWIEELPHVLWAHRTMIKSSNGETPFSLTYGTEAVIPAEIGMPTLRTAEIDQAKNNEALGINLDLIEERREQAAIQEAKSKKKMEKYYNSRVRGTSFKPGDMVYRSNEASHAKDGGKLGLK
ncbi:reverse transcriptase domain-containing protein [Tanacetum coccineum]|uniref:Reverse transcriptase domain-containing protein n=1 Tax=Tanacetum coccineum TaxID=301880 RepID=A0ABQ5EZF6_9ASTR